MCWKWLYECGHTADIECNRWIRDPNDPYEDDLTFYCWGMPSEYTKAPSPCMKCLINADTPGDKNGSKDDDKNDKGGKGDKKTNGTYTPGQFGTAGGKRGKEIIPGNRGFNTNANSKYKYEGGRGNGTWGANYLGDGWINKELIGTWPWDKPYMVEMAGLKFDENDLLVEDPDSQVATETMTVRQNTFEFNPLANYESFYDELEALSNNQAYARIESEMTFIRPTKPKDLSFIKNHGYPGTPELSQSSSASTIDGKFEFVDTPSTDLSFESTMANAQVRIPEDEDFATIYPDSLSGARV